MTADGILDTARLKQITGFESEGDMVRHLRDNCGIPTFPGRGGKGPWTTLELVNLAGRVRMGLAVNPDKKQDWL